MTVSGSDALHVEIDLRASLGGVRDQGTRNSCLSCAASDAHMHLHALTHALSAEFLYHHAGLLMPGGNGTRGLSFSAVDQTLKLDGQPSELECPYQATDSNPWVPPNISKLWHGKLSDGAGQITEIVESVRQRQPVVIAIQLTGDFLGVNSPPYIVATGGPAFGGHAVLAVGLGIDQSHGNLVLIRNSWGSGWGDSGHAWLASDYLANNMIGFRKVALR